MSARICIVGDELAAGGGDARGQGWVGRVIARTSEPGAVFTLAVPHETTTALSARWETEADRRFGEEENRLVVALSSHDLAAGVSLARSRLNLANVLDEATSRRIPSFVVGPPPRTDLDQEAQAELSGAFADVCGRRRIPYAETFAPLRSHEQWLADLNARDGVLPGQAGYGLLAWLVLHNGWHDWLGLASES